jgi:hypothetical protein
LETKAGSEAYHRQLLATVEAGTYDAGTKLSDGFTEMGFFAIQSFLVDACVLRDYFAEFLALTVEQPGETKVTTMGVLLKRKLLDRLPTSDPLRVGLADATNESGWLFQLGAYRDLVVHSTPLVIASARLFAMFGDVSIGGSGALPAVRLPIPQDPTKISRARSSGSLFKDFAKQIEAFSMASRGESLGADGLEYCHEALGQLSKLASDLSVRSPIAPKPIEVGASDIIEGTLIVNAK